MRKMKMLFEPFEMNNIKLKNRLIRSATWEGIASQNGSIHENAFEIYEELAKGGVGAIITGFTSVALHDYYFDGMMRLCDDSLIPEYKKLTNLIHKEDCPVIAQIALGAYYRSLEDDGFMQKEPDDMTADEIEYVGNQFVDAAVRAEKAGFDGVQIHAAHSFFLSRFISPAVNHRSDEYGGSNGERAKILLDIMRGIKEKTSLHVTTKINSNDFTYGGLTEEDSLEICRILAENGIDSIEVSGNGTSVGGIKAHVNEGYFVPFASKLAEEVSVPVIVVGGLRSRDTMEKVLNDTKIELISLSRPLLREAELPKLMSEDAGYISKCISCNACYSSYEHRCIFRGDNK
jgi:2,4-dienoyl-CoA reductase-like NADH-dependent reductase (Old Yellow Enzyme family)